MNNLKKFFAGLALAAGIAFAPAVTTFAADDEFAVATEETVFSIPVDENAVVVTTEEATVEETVEDVAVEETVEAAAETTVEETVVEETEEVVTPVVEEVVTSDVTVEETVEEVTENAAVETTVEETEEVVTEEVVETSNVAVLADVAETEETEETVKGEQIGAINRGYAKMDDGSDAFCVEVEKEHIEEDVEYVREDDVDGSNFNSVFVARANALENGMDEFTVNSISQLAVWNLTSGTDYTDLVDFYYGQEGIDLYNQMLSAYEGEWSFKYWMYTPNLDTFQRLIAGQAIKTPVESDIPETPVEPEEPEQPEQPEEPETPVEPEIPDVPETPVVPDEPVIPETPDVPVQPEVPVIPETPVEPEQPTQPETPSVPEEPVVETPVETPVQEVEVLSETFVEEQPVVETPVPVLSQRMYQTGDESNMAGRMIVILAAFAAVALLVKKENN